MVEQNEKRLFDIKEDEGYIQYGHSGYKYYDYKIISKETGKTLEGYCLKDSSGNWYSHSGNGEAECPMSAWAVEELENFIEEK